MKSSNTTTGRLIIADDNIRDVGGHFFELAGLLLAGANELGYQGVLATHASFAEQQAVPRLQLRHGDIHLAARCAL